MPDADGHPAPLLASDDRLLRGQGNADSLRDAVDTVIDGLTPDERSLLMRPVQPPVEQLGLPAFHVVLARVPGDGTELLSALGLGSTWNPGLALRIGHMVGIRARACNRSDPVQESLLRRVPGVVPLYDPWWERNGDGYSEDPLLASMLAMAYGLGLRGSCPRLPVVAPIIDGLDEADRSPVVLSANQRVHHEYKLSPLRAVLETGAVLGLVVPKRSIEEHPLLTRLLIDLMVHDWRDEAVVLCDGPISDAPVWPGADGFLDGAPPEGLASAAELAASARRMLLLRARLNSSTMDDTATDDDATAEKRAQLATRAAREAVVLLRNDGLLPLVTGQGMKVAVIGALATQSHHGEGLASVIEKRLRELGGVVWQHSGADRITLRLAGTERRLAVSASGALICTDAPGFDSFEFELHQWRPEVYALMSLDGNYVCLGEDATIRADQPATSYCPPAAAFGLLATGGGGMAIRHVVSGRYLAVDQDTNVVITVEDWEQAAVFRHERTADGAQEAAKLARETDVAVVVVGNSPAIDRGGAGGRVSLDLPAQQHNALRAVRAANPNTVLVVTSDYPYTMDWADANVSAILWTAHNGRATPDAIVGALFGDHSPAGRLPQTWYRSAEDVPAGRPLDVIGYRVTYLYHEREPLYPFGHGLTYTRFSYPRTQLSAASIAIGEDTTVTVDVRNDGFVDSDDVVQLYTRQLVSRVRQPRLQLRGYQRVHVRAGTTRTVSFRLRSSDLSIWDVASGGAIVERSRHEILIGGSSGSATTVAVLDVDGQPVGSRAVAGQRLQVASFDESRGVALATGPSVYGTAIATVEPRAWAAYQRCELAGVSAWDVTAAYHSDQHAVVELRLDSPTGPLLGTVVVDADGTHHPTGGDRLPPDLGVRDVVLVFTHVGITAAELIFQNAPQ